MPPTALRTLCTIVVGGGLILTSPAYSDCGLIPGSYPLSAGTELDIKDGVTMNANPLVNAKTGVDSVVDLNGGRSTVSQLLPDLGSASFPANNSTTDASDADSPFASSTDVYYNDIVVNQNKTASFIGGGPFHINKLNIKKDATVNLDPGIYYIDEIRMEDRATINITGATVTLHIGSKFTIKKKQVVINSGGAVTDLLVYLHSGAKFENTQNGEELDFTGVIYGPNSGDVKIDEDAIFNGAIITSAKVKIEKNATFTYSAADQAAISLISTCIPTLPIVAFGFNCVESGLDALAGRLYTKTSGQSFSFDIVALEDSDGNGLADGVETDFASVSDRTVTIELVDTAILGACSAYPPLNPAVSQSLGFTATDLGRKASATMNVNIAYRSIGCRMTDNTDPSNPVVGCATDLFALRPTGLTVASNMTNGTSTGTPKIQAGANFSLTTTAIAGYDGTPARDNGKLDAHAGAVQVGTVSGSFNAADPVTGIASGSSFTYSEAGSFRYLAEGVYDSSYTAIDPPGSDCTNDFSNTVVGGKIGCNFGNSSATSFFGRFHPDHFDLLVGSSLTDRIDRGCIPASSFTYMDEFLQTVFSLSARNAAGTTTQNYVGSYAKLDLSTPLSFDFSALDLGVPVSDLTGRLNLRSASGTWINGTASNIVADLALSRLVNPDGPYATLNIGINPVDTDNVALNLFDLDENQDTVDDHAALGQTEVRYGRINIANAHGSELLILPVPLTAQYYAGTGTGFVTNTDDNCTAVAVSDLVLDSLIETGQTDGNIRIQSTPDITTEATLGVPLLSNGDAGLSFCPPGNPACINPAAGNDGYAEIEVTTPAYLQFDWFGGGPANPQARASFGIYTGRSSQIFMREVY